MSSVFINDSEGPYRTVCRCLVHRPHYSARLIRFGSRGPSEFFSQMRHRNAFVGRRRTGTRHGNVYRSVSEKQGIVYRQRVLQTGTSLCASFASISRARAPKNFNSRKEPDFHYNGKNKFPERATEMESTCRSGSQLKGAWPNVRTESK